MRSYAKTNGYGKIDFGNAHAQTHRIYIKRIASLDRSL